MSWAERMERIGAEAKAVSKETGTFMLGGAATSYAAQMYAAKHAADAIEQNRLDARAEGSDRLTIADRMMRTDPRVENEAGIDDIGIRAEMSFADNNQERKTFLDKTFTPGGWVFDRFNNVAVTPEGFSAIGREPPAHGKPVRLNETGISWGDVAGYAQDAPAIVASTLAGMFAGPAGGVAGAVRGVLGAAAGGGGARLATEGVEELAGSNEQSFGEVMELGQNEAIMSAGGEGFARLGGTLTRRAAAPRGGIPLFMPDPLTPNQMKNLGAAEALGAAPSPIAVAGGGGVGEAYSSVVRSIAGDASGEINHRAVSEALESIKNRLSGHMNPDEIGGAVKETIRLARKNLSDEANVRFTSDLRGLGGGADVVPTQGLKKEAQRLLDEMPRTAGKEADTWAVDQAEALGAGTFGVNPGTPASVGRVQQKDTTMSGLLNWVKDMPDYVSADYLHNTMSGWRKQQKEPMLNPEYNVTQLGSLRAAGREAYEQAPTSPEGILYGVDKLKGELDQLRKTDEWYKGEKARFSGALLKRLTKDESLQGSIAPEDVIEAVMGGARNHLSRVKELKNVLPANTMKEVERGALERITDKATKLNKREGGTEIFDGMGFAEELNRIGPQRLKLLFGAEMADDLDKLSRVIMLVSPADSGTSLVARAMLVNFNKNKGKLAWTHVVAKAMSSKPFRRWMTTGFGAPYHSEAGKLAYRKIAQGMSAAAQAVAREYSDTELSREGRVEGGY